MKPIRSQVSAKILILVIPLLLVLLTIGAYLLRTSMVNMLFEGYQANLRGETITIEQALQQAFMVNDFQTAQKVVANLSYHGQIDTVRILNQDGKILASSIPDEVGVRLDIKSQQCLLCHNSSQNLSAAPVQKITTKDSSEQVIVTSNPLDNQIACQSCHPPTGKALGMILAEHTTAPVEAQVTAVTITIYLGTGLLFLLLSGVIWLTINGLVARPLHALAGGETGPTFTSRPDEYGSLARQHQEMESSVKEKDSQLITQRRSFNAMLALSESIDVTLTAEKVLQFAIGRVVEVTGFVATAMRLLEPNQKFFRLVAHSGMTPQMVEALRIIPVEIGFTGDVFKTHRAAYTSDLSQDPRLESPAPVEGGFRSLISVPFLSGDRLMGTMELGLKEVHIWTEDEVHWLELMGRSIGNVLHHIETSNQLQGMAIIQERSRIAQEIHDGLAQLIGTLRLWAEKAQIALHENDLQEAQDSVQKIEQTARDAYASLREEILGLRETILPGQGIVPVIREFLTRYKRQWGIETQLLFRQNQPDGKERLSVLPAAEIQLLRIIQESLTNVRRHANASLVVISMDDGEEQLRVEILDNGQGFDPQAVPEEKLGLRIMRERAASVGGRVTVESIAGEGTHLIIELPKRALPLQA